ncbi:MAG: prepilin-type N-terminal cleavage/methylation domain-containing protein [Verrucomicrobia bacterium]|nr:prepilin-type N-terminal cleavage/methylation domain-containing protein [Verrucomicrobiota bacterium]
MTSPAPHHPSPAIGHSAAATPSLRFGCHGNLSPAIRPPVQVCLKDSFQSRLWSSGSSFSPTRHGAAFTLIELLVVIAIIAILAGLAFPAVQGAMGSAKKAQARNDVNQLAAAVKAFQLEYGRLPATKDDAAEVVKALIGSNATVNPRNIVFFEPKTAKGGKKGWDGSNYLDPWGSPYKVVLDLGYSNKITTDIGDGSKTYFTTVVVMSTNSTNKTQWISNVK